MCLHLTYRDLLKHAGQGARSLRSLWVDARQVSGAEAEENGPCQPSPQITVVRPEK